MGQDDETILRFLRGLDDRALLRLLALEADDYRPEALAFAREEAARRGLRPVDAAGYYARFPDAVRSKESGFCAACEAETVDPTRENFVWSPRLTLGIGRKYFADRFPCPECGSDTYSKWFGILVPFIPLGKCRVIWGAWNPLGTCMWERAMPKKPRGNE